MAVSEEHRLDEVIQALYESISGAAGEPRDWDRMRALFYPGARLVRTSVDDRGRPKAQSMDVEEYVRDVSPYLWKHPFYEAEISRRLDRFGNVAHALSTYEARHDPADPEPFKRGVNSIQLYNDGTRWWIVNALWDNEREGNPVPARYLPGSREGTLVECRSEGLSDEPADSPGIAKGPAEGPAEEASVKRV